MKKNLIIAIALMTVSTSLIADFVDSANQQINTVAAAKNSADDTWVTLKGTIVKKISGNEYIFKDSTGEIQVEIDKRAWNGIDVTADTLIQISGEIDKGTFETTEIDVKKVELVPAAAPAVAPSTAQSLN